MSDQLHISGIRIAHVECADRAVQVNRPQIHDGPIQWERWNREPDGKVRVGRGKSGLSYRLKQAREWQVLVAASRGREVLVGSARLQDHALALAGMWEQAVLAGRVDID